MAILSVSPFTSTPKPLPSPLSVKPQLSRTSYPFPCQCSLLSDPQREHFPGLKKLESAGNLFSSIGESLSRAGLLAIFSASLVLVDPALAFKGGGPYGAEVTRGQDLTGRDFSGKTLIKQDFKTSILRQANFKGAKLLGASFFDADLTGADLSDADLRGVDFSLANVTKVNLSNANLEGALATGNTSFKGSVITGADFTDVPLRDDQRKYLCKAADGVNPTTGNATRDTLLCG
ncbi:thylakoid lumenal 15 kDa protein 1, chloroplastic isoform X2 [Macadamia integrifolia]|uniref:thylakoid lumenal 15 kDa protein 1, chloroplastic isoform X2 n=1 Tax=Macadamia integrifolia TaxID=60698 RepID=UPI001C502768|nr:thylakoid lumenal 15 kDa protein 1, chloroplastic isoform X2 [Macadamia integrifolia]